MEKLALIIITICSICSAIGCLKISWKQDDIEDDIKEIKDKL
jgi:hypothetical protein